jgi:hypothetical protein
MDWLRKAPTAVVVSVVLVCGVAVLAVLGGFVALEIAGKPTDDYRSFINTIANLVVLPLAGVGTIAATSAAKSASKAEDNTNGTLTALHAQVTELQQRISDKDAS